MDKKLKIVIVVLSFFSLGTIIFAFTVLHSKGALRNELENTKRQFQKEREELVKKVSDLIEEKKDLQSKLDEVNRQLDEFSLKNSELEKKYEAVIKERDGLLEKIKSITTTVPYNETVALSIPTAAPEEAYWATVLKKKADLEIKLNQLKNEVNNLKIQLKELGNVKSSLELEIKNIIQEKQDVERRLSYNEKLLDSISIELVREKEDKRKLEELFKILKRGYRIAIHKINNLNEDKLDLERKFQQIQKDNMELVRKIKEMDMVLGKKILETEELKEKYLSVRSSTPQSVELPPIIIRSAEPKEPVISNKELFKGRVLAVNREHNFIVIDLGEEQGVKIGDLFSIYRENEKIAEVEVIQIRKNVCACDIRQQNVPIAVGDLVK
ncbi:MAG: hypothetical protein NC826_05580 [Candidatus Omnitrophica bacterium]|nr:hypothetical protein [Candidatus Omnitrophota bacterium]